MFWPKHSATGTTSPFDLSLGQALLIHDALLAHARTSTPADSARLGQTAQAIGSILRHWAAAASRKAEAELPQRLNLWQVYLEEILEGQASAGEYAHQVRNRVIAERLLPMAAPVPSEQERRLQVLDRSLRGFFQPGGFAWEAGLVSAYRQPQFWFLYGGIRPSSA